MKYKIKITLRGGEDYAEEGIKGYGNFPERVGFLSHRAYERDTNTTYFYVRDDDASSPAHLFEDYADLGAAIANIDEIDPISNIRLIEIVPVS